jgi:hypothetical protein
MNFRMKKEFEAEKRTSGRKKNLGAKKEFEIEKDNKKWTKNVAFLRPSIRSEKI